MEIYLERKRELVEGSTFTRKSMWTVSYYTLIGIFGIFITSWVVDYVQLPFTLSLQYEALAYSVLMAIAEEQFFRGFVTDALLTYTPKIKSKYTKFFSPILETPYLPLVFSALIFGFYHVARYGSSLNSMMYVIVGGFILAWIAYKSRRLSPSMCAHVTTNIIAVLGGI